MFADIARRRRNATANVVLRIALLMFALAPVSSLLSQGASPLRFTLATNPIAPLLGAVSVDAEARVGTRGVSVGLGGTYDTNREYLSWLQGKLKYALRGEALRGGAVGATAGVVVLRNLIRGDCSEAGCPLSNQAFPSIGAIADWNWFPGARDRIMLGAGVGVQNLFGTVGFPVDRIQLDGRLVIGIGF